jgi:mycothiol synthase
MTTLTRHYERAYAGEADLQPMCDLLAACEAVDHLEETTTITELRLQVSDPQVDPTRDMRLWTDETRRLVALAALWLPPPGATQDGFLSVAIHPDARHDADLEAAVMAWAAARLREVAGDRPAQLFMRVVEHDAYRRELAEQHGYNVVRYYFRMARPLDQPIPEPQFPAGYTLRSSRGEADAERWIDAYNRSFIDHWNHHPANVESHRHWLQDAKYRPELDLLACTADGTVAAFCFCAVDPDENALTGRNEGHIHLLGTRRGHRHLGLGRAMLLAGLRRLHSEGLASAVLTVDAANPTGALGLYENNGFRKVRMRLSYCKPLETL